MSFKQELASWWSPGHLPIAAVPEVGTKAPVSEQLTFPAPDGRPTVITFLRHCGCPFAEKTFRAIRSIAASHPDMRFIAVSHSDIAATERWLSSVEGAGPVHVLVDSERKLYAQWGMGVSDFWHVLNPWSLWSVYTTGRHEHIWNKPTESGNRWQTAGSFGVDQQGFVQWGRKCGTADEVFDFEEAVQCLLQSL